MKIIDTLMKHIEHSPKAIAYLYKMFYKSMGEKKYVLMDFSDIEKPEIHGLESNPIHDRDVIKEYYRAENERLTKQIIQLQSNGQSNKLPV
jgi:hypothetical protein